MTYFTDGLIEVLLELAREADPGPVTIHLMATPAGDLPEHTSLDDAVQVFSEFYHPETGDSVEAVFGVDVSIPPGQTPGIFVSHPSGPLSPTTGDEFAERMLIAVPPWDREYLALFDRGGEELPFEIL